MDSLLSVLTVTRSIYDTISAIRNGPELVQRTRENVLQFHRLLERIRQIYVHDGRPTDDALEHAGLFDIIDASAADLNKFASKLRGLQSTHEQNTSGRLWTRLKVLVSEKDLEIITAKISRHSSRISMHLDLTNRYMSRLSNVLVTPLTGLGSKISLDLRSQVAETRSTLEKLGQASIADFQTLSIHQDKIKFRLDSYASTLVRAAFIGNTQTCAVQNTLAQILELLQQPPRYPQARQASFIPGAIGGHRSKPDESFSITTPPQLTTNEVNESLFKSIQRLGQLVREKERTFDTFDSDYAECDAINGDLGNILKAAKQSARAIAARAKEGKSRRKYSDVARSISHFTKAHASNILTINAEGLRNSNA